MHFAYAKPPAQTHCFAELGRSTACEYCLVLSLDEHKRFDIGLSFVLFISVSNKWF